MTWRKIDLDALPPSGARMRLARGAGSLTGHEARFAFLATDIRRGEDQPLLHGPWIVGYLSNGKEPLIYLSTAWEWFDETVPSEEVNASSWWKCECGHTNSDWIVRHGQRLIRLICEGCETPRLRSAP
jgi:hypothetical protein